MNPKYFLCLYFLLLFTANSIAGEMVVPVQVHQAQRINIAPIIWVTGTVIGHYDSKIAAEVKGRIDSIVDVGDRVVHQDKIAKLDDIQLRMKVDEAMAEIIPIEAKLEFYKKEVNRLEMLESKNNAAKNRLDEVISDRDEMLGLLAIRKARLAQIEDENRRTNILAPFSGVVSERYKTQGEWVDVGDALVRLIDPGKLEIQARIPVTSINFVKQNDLLRISDGTRDIAATIKTIVPIGDELSRLYEIRLTFDQKEWMVGHAVKVAVPAAETRNVIAVSRDALVIRRDGIVLYKITENNLAELVPVETGIAEDGLIEVIGNVSEGDVVVIRGNERLRPGQQINIMENHTKP